MRRLISIILILVVFSSFSIVNAQEDQPDGPVYIVESGDSLWGIAAQFGISMEELAAKNGIADPGQLSIGARLVIPGFEGLSGVLTFETIPFGENIESLSNKFEISRDALLHLNRFTTPDDAYAGSQLIVTTPVGAPVGDGQIPSGGRVTLKAGQSLMELAITNGVSPWFLVNENHLRGTWDTLAGEQIYLSNDEVLNHSALPKELAQIEFTSFPLIQGHTLTFKIDAPDAISLAGQFHDRELNFTKTTDGSFVTLQGVHALLDPGAYPLSLNGLLSDGTPVSFYQRVLVEDGNYIYDPPLRVDSETTDIQNNETENQLWFDVVAPVTMEKYWNGVMQSPVPASLSNCFPSVFGNRRSYNQSGYFFFHTGLDFCGRPGVEIYAPAPGRVVFTGPLTVRGNATVIDQGWGVYSAYAHQTEFRVSKGDWVETGQLIGLVGETGRVTGPHLHWEIIVGGVQVDPMDWLSQEFP
ncbi:MAG: peptidoglycan DD-metalloendopeptidase family protein [Anaerolineales bacterium]|nr:peptidoglycan DD-metalloendopeptidase family protein [Anaerolineales bacterium]